jgi:membrane fusion protein, multidrug efflux system
MARRTGSAIPSSELIPVRYIHMIFARFCVFAISASISLGPAAQTPPSGGMQGRPAASAQGTLGRSLPTLQEEGGSAPTRVLLVPELETTLSSTVAARISVFNASLGSTFKEGDLLVGFDCDENLAKVDMSKAELAASIEQHEAKVKMQGLGQASDVEVALAASAVNKSKAQLQLNQTQVTQCKLIAPFSGRVSKVSVRNHMTVTPGMPMLELVNDGPLKVKLNAPSRLLPRLKAGGRLDIAIDETGARYQTAIGAVNSRVDPVSQTVEVEAKLTRSYRELLPGMSGVADFSTLR